MEGAVDAVIRTEGLTKVYPAAEAVHALRGVDLHIERGAFVSIVGASGSGKSTLMHILGCLDQPTGGRYWLDGVEVSRLDKDARADLRNQKIGFVFQSFNLLPRTTALENVELPLMYDRKGRIKDPRGHAIEALRRVGLEGRMDHEPNRLSGGQQQRVAIARALVNEPALLLADEPTGNLDSRTSMDIMALFQELNEGGLTVVVVTHEPDIAQCSERIVQLSDGLVVRDERVADRRDARSELAALTAGGMADGGAGGVEATA
jgi:putative ABC transport system ATP-binding protein